MSNRQPLSKGEMEVARVVWKLGEASVGAIFQAIPTERGLDYSTVQTYIRRLESKGYLKSRRRGRNKMYRAKIRPSKVIGEVVDDLLSRLFDGDFIPLVRHLIQEREVTDEEWEQLRLLLDDDSSETPNAAPPPAEADPQHPSTEEDDHAGPARGS